MKHEKVPFYSVRYTEPFSGRSRYEGQGALGATLAEIVAVTPNLPADFNERGVICINGNPIGAFVDGRWHYSGRHAFSVWCRTKPLPGSVEAPVLVTLHRPPRGGDRGGTVKNVVGIVAAIALTVVTAGIAAGALAPLLAGTALAGLGTGFGAQALALGVGILGSLAINALTAPPATKEKKGDNDKGAASAQGNVLERGAPVSRVCGTRKVFPALGQGAGFDRINGDDYAWLFCVLAGPHKLEDIRVDGTPIADDEGFEYETREGFDTDTPITLITEQVFTAEPRTQLSTHKIDPETDENLDDQTTPANSLPVWHSFSTRKAPDRVDIHLDWFGGLYETAAPSDAKGVPIRVQIRRRGDTDFINLPEVHLQNGDQGELRKMLSLFWEVDPSPIVGSASAPTKNGFVLAYEETDDTANSSAWVADRYFSTSAFVTGSPKVLRNGATTTVTNTHLYDDRVEFFLDPAVFPQDAVYEIRLKRGYAYDVNGFTSTTYSYDGTGGVAVRDFFFWFQSTNKIIAEPPAPIVSDTAVTRIVNRWYQHPCPTSGFAIIAVRAKNKALNNVSVLASGYTYDYNAISGEWDVLTTTSNPAPHYRDVLSGVLNLDPLPDELRDDDAIQAWRDRCEALGYTCDAIFEGTRTSEVLTLLASCGYARPYASDIWSVIEDRDRTDEAPVMLLSERNSWNNRWEKAYPRLPDGFRYSFPDIDNDYDLTEEIQYTEGYTGGDGGRFEAITFDGMVDADKARGRAKFDLDQARLRDTFYYCDVPPMALALRRGDLVAMQNRILFNRSGTARIREKLLDGGGTNIVGFVLDSTVPIGTLPDFWSITDFWAVEDFWAIGQTNGICIQRLDNTISIYELEAAGEETDTVMLATPIPVSTPIEDGPDIDGPAGSLVGVGQTGFEYMRGLIGGIRYNADLSATLMIVDEAPELYRGPISPGGYVEYIYEPGSYELIVPPRFDHMEWLVWGSGGEAGILSSYTAWGAGTDGTTSSITDGTNTLTATGGEGGNAGTSVSPGAAPVGGAGSGGSFNESGQNGLAGDASVPVGTGNGGNAGGSAYGGGTGGVGGLSPGPGTDPGGGMGTFGINFGANQAMGPSGAGGGFAYKDFTSVDIPPGTTLTISVGDAPEGVGKGRVIVRIYGV